MNKKIRTDRVGETTTNKQGTYTIVQYNNYNDIIVKQDDGYTFKTSYHYFAKGTISGNRHNDKDEKVGRTRVNRQGFQMTIVEYNSTTDCVIEFNDKYKTRIRIGYLYFKKGTARNPNYRWLAEKVLIDKNDIEKNPTAFEKYRAMIDRCYGKQKYNNVVYKGCKICEEWFDFENFVKWFNTNYYTIENESMELDKDLFGNGKLYSPETCIFVSHKLNSWFAMFKDYRDRKTNLPMGVSLYDNGYGKKRYRVVSLEKGQLFDDLEEASKAYKENVKRKFKEYAEIHKNEIPNKLYDKLINYEIQVLTNSAQCDIIILSLRQGGL